MGYKDKYGGYRFIVQGVPEIIKALGRVILFKNDK
jgi:hypothetical protein